VLVAGFKNSIDFGGFRINSEEYIGSTFWKPADFRQIPSISPRNRQKSEEQKGGGVGGVIGCLCLSNNISWTVHKSRVYIYFILKYLSQISSFLTGDFFLANTHDAYFIKKLAGIDKQGREHLAHA
jgi:hypothetical protein